MIVLIGIFFFLKIKALFDSLSPEDFKNGILVLGGDGRYFNREASQVLLCISILRQIQSISEF